MSILSRLIGVLLCCIPAPQLTLLSPLIVEAQSIADSRLGFPVRILEEKLWEEESSAITAKVYLAPGQFNKENLHRLFHWYSVNNADKKVIMVYVFTHLGESNGVSGYKNLVDSYDAVFFRNVNGATSKGGDNEWFNYCPDLDKPDERRTVVLQGKAAFTKETVVSSSDKDIGNLNFRITLFELNGSVEPARNYYKVEYKSKQMTDFSHLFTTYTDVVLDDLDKHLVVVEGEICYIVIGSVFVVTSDGGSSWSKWVIEKNYPAYECCLKPTILAAHVGKDGKGTMAIKLPGSTAELLLTSNYGKTWLKH